jgi:hypothetical protein
LRFVPVQSRSLPAGSLSGLDGVKSGHVNAGLVFGEEILQLFPQPRLFPQLRGLGFQLL